MLRHATTTRFLWTYTLAVGVVKRLELDNIGVSNNAHDLQFTVLHWVSIFGHTRIVWEADLEPLILQDTLDGGILVGRREFGLEDNTE